MKNSFRVLVVFLVIFFFSSTVRSFGGFFIENRGQVVDYDRKTRSDVLCYAAINGYTVYVTNSGVSFVGIDDKSEVKRQKLQESEQDGSISVTRIDLPIPGLSAARPHYLNSLPCYFNYYLPHCKDGIDNVSAYSIIDYPELAEGVGLQMSVHDGILVLKLNGDSRNLHIREICKTIQDGIKERKLEKSCIVNSAMDDNNAFCRLGTEDGTSGFNDNVVWASYLGGMGGERDISIDTDEEDNIILGGYTGSLDFPTTEGCFQKSRSGSFDLFIIKFTSDHQLLWGTYIGGYYEDVNEAIKVSPADASVWFCGNTFSYDFPVTNNAFQKKINGGYQEAFLGNISFEGHLNYLSYYGGEGSEVMYDVTIDKSGNAFFCGSTSSRYFPVLGNPFRDSLSGKSDGFIVKYDKDYNRIYSTYWGGSNDDDCFCIESDKTGNLFVSGKTLSDDYPLKNQIQPYSNDDIFITKFDNNMNILWSTYYGGKEPEYNTALTIDRRGNPIIQGLTKSNDFLTTKGAFKENFSGPAEYFIVKLDNSGKLLWSTFTESVDTIISISTYLGGVAVDTYNSVAVLTSTRDDNLKTTDSSLHRNKVGGVDIYLLVLDEKGGFVYATYIGGTNDDLNGELAFNSRNNFLVTAYTWSPDNIVTDNAFQKTFRSNTDNYIMELGIDYSSIKDSCDETGFEYTDFTDDANISYTGKARRENTNIRLTESDVNRVGAAWYKYQMPVKNGFTTEFSFRMTDGENGTQSDSSCPGADGLAFVIQNNDTKAVGLPGGRIGYDPVPNSLAVEFDLFDNDENQIESLGDPNGNHIAVMSKGKEANSSNHSSGAELGKRCEIFELLSNATVYYSKIDYNIKEAVLRVYLSKTRDLFNNPFVEIRNLDLAKLLDLYEGEWAYVGFTSATGSSYQNHDILSWKFCPKPTDSPQTDVEEESPVNSSGLVLYPNPVEDYLSVNAGETGDRLVICDLMGREVKSLTVEGSSGIDVSGLPRGCYIVRVLSERMQKYSGTFVKK